VQVCSQKDQLQTQLCAIRTTKLELDMVLLRADKLCSAGVGEACALAERHVRDVEAFVRRHKRHAGRPERRKALQCAQSSAREVGEEMAELARKVDLVEMISTWCEAAEGQCILEHLLKREMASAEPPAAPPCHNLLRLACAALPIEELADPGSPLKRGRKELGKRSLAEHMGAAREALGVEKLAASHQEPSRKRTRAALRNAESDCAHTLCELSTSEAECQPSCRGGADSATEAEQAAPAAQRQRPEEVATPAPRRTRRRKDRRP
jgi:hypothetical protein